MTDKKTTEVEFVNPRDAFEWTQDPKLPEGTMEAIFYKDEQTGTYCRFLSFPVGFKSGDKLLVHDFDEVVFVVSGALVNERLNEVYQPGTVAVFPAGVGHGPLRAPVGALGLEFRYYKKK